jgi:hypothetical protein
MKRWLFFTSFALVTVYAEPDIVIEENETSRNVFRRGIHPRGQIEPRMTGGFPSGPGAFPFTVHTFDGDQGLCGGVLVHSDVIITAASCQSVFEATNTTYIGSNDLYGRDFAPLIAISSALPHPDFDEVTYENDIMLLHLETPVGSAVATIAKQIPSDDQLLFALGFGRLNPLDESFPTTRHEVDMPAVSFSACRDVYADAVDSERNVCAGIAGTGPCDGDEGAPLLDAVTTTLQGIWSYSEGCGAAPAVFTRVAYYDSWIREFICNNSQELPDDCSSPGEDDDVPVTDDEPITDDEPTNDDVPRDDDITVPVDDDVSVDDDAIPTPAPTHEVLQPNNGKGKGKGKRSRKSVDSKSHKKNRSDKLSKKSSSSGKGSTGKGSNGKGSLSNGKGSAGKGSGKGSFGKGASGKDSIGKGSTGKGSSGKGYSDSGSGGKGSLGKGYTGKGSSGKGSSGKGSGGKGSTGKGSAGKGSRDTGSSGNGSGSKGSSGKGSSGKGSFGKGSNGKRSSGKGSSGKKSYGKGSSSGKRLYGKGSKGQSETTSTDDRAFDVSPYNILERRHNRSPYSP